MKRVVTFLIGFVLLLLTLISALAIRINEIMYNPEGDDNNREWVEIYFEDEEIDITNWTIGDNASNDTLVLFKYDNSNYILIVEDGFNFSSIPAKIYSAGAAIGNGLGNSGDIIYLYDANKTLVDSISYNNTYANGNGKSLEFLNGSWHESIYIGGTPGKENSINAMNATTNTTNSSNGTEITDEDCNASISIKTKKDIYENGETIKFRHILSNGSFPFRIEYWIEDLFGDVVKAKRTTENLNEKSYTPRIDEKEKALMIKSILYADCDEDKSNNIAEKLVLVRNEDFEESKEESTSISRFEYEIIRYTDKIISGKEFSIFLRIKSDDSPHLVSAISYVYRNSKHYSNEAHQELTLDRNEENVIELKNVANASPGEYKLKVKIKKDSLKTEYEITKNITIAKEEKNDSEIDNPIIKNTVEEIYAPGISNEPNASREEKEEIDYFENKTIVYKSKGSAAREWIKYAIIGFLALVSIILVWRR